jgi:hypothetical protein
MTLVAVVCVVIRFLVNVPFLGLLAVTYLPLMVVYFLVRGPSLWRHWRSLSREYEAIAKQRRELLEQARVHRSDDSDPPQQDPHSST